MSTKMNNSTMHSILSMQLIALPFISWFLFIPWNSAEGTTYPIPEKLKKEHYYNDELAGTLEEKLASLKKKFRELEERAMKLKGVEKLTPFTHAKYTTRYTPEQVEDFMKTGWIKTKKFGWPLSSKNILETDLPPSPPACPTSPLGGNLSTYFSLTHVHSNGNMVLWIFFRTLYKKARRQL